MRRVRSPGMQRPMANSSARASPRSAARVRRNSAALAAASPARNCCRATRRSRSPRPTIVSKVGVGVHRLAVAARDHHADIETVGGSLDDIGERRALTEADVAGRVGEEEEQPDGRQRHQHGDEHGRADAAGDDAKGDDRADDDRADGRQVAGKPLQRRDRVEGRGRQLDCVVLAHAQGGYLISEFGRREAPAWAMYSDTHYTQQASHRWQPRGHGQCGPFCWRGGVLRLRRFTRQQFDH